MLTFDPEPVPRDLISFLDSGTYHSRTVSVPEPPRKRRKVIGSNVGNVPVPDIGSGDYLTLARVDIQIVRTDLMSSNFAAWLIAVYRSLAIVQAKQTHCQKKRMTRFQ